MWPISDLGYVLVAAVLFVLIAYEVLSHEMEAWRQGDCALVAATLVLPLESFDYTLSASDFPLALVVCAAPVGSGQGRVAVLLLAVCLVPADYYYFAMWAYRTDGGISTFVVHRRRLSALVVVALVGSGRAPASALAAGLGRLGRPTDRERACRTASDRSRRSR